MGRSTLRRRDLGAAATLEPDVRRRATDDGDRSAGREGKQAVVAQEDDAFSGSTSSERVMRVGVERARLGRRLGQSDDPQEPEDRLVQHGFVEPA